VNAKQGRGVSFRKFEGAAPEFGRAGRRLLVGEVAFLATVSRRGAPRLAPVSPIFSGDHLYVSAGAKTPKRYDLENDGRYVMHAMLGPSDEEFQLAGRGALVTDAAERERVHADFQFQFQRDDPVFRLEIERSLWGHWEKVGQPGTYPVRRIFRVAEGESPA
jgi:hypothetical protein